MSNKSLFEKLFEEVMQDDAEALGLPSGEGSEGAGDMGGEDFGSEEGGDEVTLTLDRATAQKLHDLLGGILGGEEETEDEGEFGDDEDMGGEDEGMGDEDMGDEAAEDEADEEEDEKDETMHEAPQSKYETFETKSKAEKLQKKTNARVEGALANKTSAHGKAQQTSQTQGTAHYMPFNKKVDQAKPGGSIKVNNPKYNPNGQGDSIFS